MLDSHNCVESKLLIPIERGTHIKALFTSLEATTPLFCTIYTNDSTCHESKYITRKTNKGDFHVSINIEILHDSFSSL